MASPSCTAPKANTDEVKIDCGSCRGCCYQLVSLEDSDLKNGPWQLDPVFDNPVLQRRPDGACVYLDRITGCTIYNRRPKLCRVFDCGDWFVHTTPQMKRDIGIFGTREDREMLASGKKFASQSACGNHTK